MVLLSCLQSIACVCAGGQQRRQPTAWQPFMDQAFQAILCSCRSAADSTAQAPATVARSCAGCQQPQQPTAWEPAMERFVWKLPGSRGAARHKC